MSLNSQEDYERLGEHLAVIDTPLTNFAGKHGYTVYPRLSGGRYPNRRITQEGLILRSIQISMDNDRQGERFDHFFPDIPYTIFGAAWVDDHNDHIRWHCPNIRIEAIPFSTLVQTFDVHLNFSIVTFQGSQRITLNCALPPRRWLADCFVINTFSGTWQLDRSQTKLRSSPNTLTLPMKSLVWARLEDSLLISRHGKSSSELGSVMI